MAKQRTATEGAETSGYAQEEVAQEAAGRLDWIAQTHCRKMHWTARGFDGRAVVAAHATG
jgi:hypothetical protein